MDDASYVGAQPHHLIASVISYCHLPKQFCKMPLINLYACLALPTKIHPPQPQILVLAILPQVVVVAGPPTHPPLCANSISTVAYDAHALKEFH